jgi:hypothetical protein
MRRITLSTGQFDYRAYSPGAEGIVATVTVPRNKVWMVDPGQPIVVALPAKQTVNIGAGSTSQFTLDPRAPVCDFLDAPDAGTPEASIVVEAVDDNATVSVDSVTTTDGFATKVTLTESGGTATDVDVYSIAERGTITLQRRNSGKSNVTDELQVEDALTFAFSSPDDPESDRQLRWDSSTAGTSGVLPPKFKLDMVYYDDQDGLAADDEPSNLLVELPLRQRDLAEDETASGLRQRVTRSMRA